MVVDSSALAAILLGEPDGPIYATAMGAAVQVAMSAATYLEIAIVLDSGADPRAGRELDALIRRIPIDVVPVTQLQAQIARQAYLDFGRGNHPARLNFGDCFAYALAKELGEPLLFKGDDFAQTDIEPAL
jgi:ribonuclease VapC